MLLLYSPLTLAAAHSQLNGNVKEALHVPNVGNTKAKFIVYQILSVSKRVFVIAYTVVEASSLYIFQYDESRCY